MDTWRFDPSLPDHMNDKMKTAKTKAEVVRTVIAVLQLAVAIVTLIVVLT